MTWFPQHEAARRASVPWTTQPTRGSRSFGAKNNDPLEAFGFTGLVERLSGLERSVRDKPQRWGRKSCLWVKYHNKRGQNQEFSSTVCVDEDLRFLPHYCPRTYGALFFVRLLREPLRSLLRHVHARAGPDGNEESPSRVPSLTTASLSLPRVPLCWSFICRALGR